jgi:hypothetical protein
MTEVPSARDQLVERLFGATIAALDLLHVWVGERLGLSARVPTEACRPKILNPAMG